MPQGSVLGPLLFLISINDLEQGIKPNIRFSADDIMIYSNVSEVDLTAVKLNHELNVISKRFISGKCYLTRKLTDMLSKYSFRIKGPNKHFHPFVSTAHRSMNTNI